MRKFTYDGKTLKIGDKAIVKVRLLSGERQNLYGYIVRFPEFSSDTFRVRINPEGPDRVDIYPRLSDLAGVKESVEPENWPPQEHDVWEAPRASSFVWHCLDGDLVGASTLRTYSSSESSEFLRNNPDAKLAYRRS
jgi:hypothetical protein